MNNEDASQKFRNNNMEFFVITHDMVQITIKSKLSVIYPGDSMWNSRTKDVGETEVFDLLEWARDVENSGNCLRLHPFITSILGGRGGSKKFWQPILKKKNSLYKNSDKGGGSKKLKKTLT